MNARARTCVKADGAISEKIGGYVNCPSTFVSSNFPSLPRTRAKERAQFYILHNSFLEGRVAI